MNEQYTQLEWPTVVALEACPCCGSTPELWQYITEAGDAQKVVMCPNSEPIGPQDGIADEGCLLYMPPNGFYRATIREALKYWNEFAKALMVQQRKNRWATHQVLRDAATQPQQEGDKT